MKETGYIKLWRQTLSNQVFKKDPTAWRVFEVLLMISDWDSGRWDGGRHVLSAISGVKATTLYKALKRLEKADMVTLRSNNKYTTIHICKWEKYQSDSNTSGNNKVITKGYQSNNKVTLYKEVKKLRSKEQTLVDLISMWITQSNSTINDPVKWSTSLVKKYGFAKVQKIFNQMNTIYNPSPALLATKLKKNEQNETL